MASSARKKRAPQRRKGAPRPLARRAVEFLTDLPLPRLSLVPIIAAAVSILLLTLLLLRGIPDPDSVPVPPPVVGPPEMLPEAPAEQAPAPPVEQAPAPPAEPEPEKHAEPPAPPVPAPAVETPKPALPPTPDPTPTPAPEPAPAPKPAPAARQPAPGQPGNQLPGAAPNVPAGKAPAPEAPGFGRSGPLPSQGPVPVPAPLPPQPRASMPAPAPAPPPAAPVTSPSVAMSVAAAKPAPRSAVEPPAWERHALATPTGAARPRIVVVIDDMGVDRPRSTRAAALPGPLTLSWLPYARDLPEQTRAARARGHELMVHVPMEPNGKLDPGPEPLTVKLSAAEIRRRLAEDLGAFEGYVGINNHMGSRFTADAAGMAEVMAMLGQRGLLFLDSRTTPQSKAPELAARHGVPLVARDVFLDHDMAAPAVDRQLAQVEAIARSNGIAIAIGHPHDATLKALARWLPTLEAKGFQLVPLSAAVRATL